MKDERLSALIKEAEVYSFDTNCYQSSHGGYFSRPSVAMQAWIAAVEDYIIAEHGRESSPFRVFARFARRNLDGNEKKSFDQEKEIILSALHACARIQPSPKGATIDKLLALTNLFDRFHIVARQLRKRHAGRTTLDIEDEYDVQDLLGALLRLYFDDVRREEWTPSYAGGSARMDFLLKEEQVVVEVKMTRKNLGDSELGSQLIEDKARYKAHPACKTLVCFVYDPDGRITNPKGISNDLNANEPDFEIQIVIRPEA